MFVFCNNLAKKVHVVEEKPGKQTAPVAVKKWTKEDEAACKIQKYIRRFLARRQLARRKRERADYEKLMDKLEKEVLLLIIIATILLSCHMTTLLDAIVVLGPRHCNRQDVFRGAATDTKRAALSATPRLAHLDPCSGG